MSPLASLPMYDWPEVSGTIDRFWAAVRATLLELDIDAPDERFRPDESIEHWRDPRLLISQTCGLPLRRHLLDDVAIIGAFDHRLPNTEPGDYHSVVIVHGDHPADALDGLTESTVAVNGPESQSGHAALRYALIGHPTGIARGVASGSHRRSIQLVADGSCDVAAIDAVSWELALEQEPAAARCRVIARTPPTAGLPLITAAANAPLLPALRAAIAHGITNLAPEDRATLRIFGLVGRTADDYALLDQRWAEANTATVPRMI